LCSLNRHILPCTRGDAPVSTVGKAPEV
jgi:hypothetical protein